MKRRPITTTFVALALAAPVGACSGDDDDGGGATAEADLTAAQQDQFEDLTDHAECMRENGLATFPDPEVTDDGDLLLSLPWLDEVEDTEVRAAEEACRSFLDQGEEGGEGGEGEGAVAPAGWEEVPVGGDCQCSDGSRYNLWTRDASPEKVVFFLEDGGACFSAETCDPENELYNTVIEEGPDTQGIFDFDDERNPVADHSVVFAPYCSGDVFLGNATTEYGDRTIQHKGYANGTAALDHLAATYPAATEIVVVGESAGSVAAPLYGGLVAERFPNARITVLADGSGSYPDIPELNDTVAASWGIGTVLPQWTSFPEMFVHSGSAHPSITFARHDYAYDENQHLWYPRIGVEVGDLLERIDANEVQIEAGGVNLASYIAPGSEHTALTESRFYSEAVAGESLVDWVTRLLAGEPVTDVHCADCARRG